MRKQSIKIIFGCVLFLAAILVPDIASAAPSITVSGNSVTILGSPQTISLTCTLIDPNGTGLLKSGSNIITVFVTSSATPGNVATCGPIYSNDTIADGLGNLSTTYYSVKVFTVSNGVVASTPAKQNFYAFTGSGTVDLATATPLAPSFFTGPSGNVVMPGTLTVTGAAALNGGATVSGAAVLTNPVNLATQVTGTLPGANYAAVNLAAGNVNGGATGTLPAANLPATTGQCTGVQFSRGQAAGGTENCATPPTFVASGASHAVGYVPDPGASAGTTRFLREDATWVAPSNSSAVFVGGCSGTASAGSTLTLFGLGNFSGISCTQSGVAGSIPMPSAGTLKNLRVVAVTGGVNASSGVVTVMDNGVSTGITCTLGTGTTCNDTTHTASVAAGDLILVQFTTQGAETLAGVRVTVEKQ